MSKITLTIMTPENWRSKLTSEGNTHMTNLNDITQLQKARERVWQSISDYEQRARNHRHDSENFLTTLANKTSEFINLGVAVIGEYDDHNWQNKLGDTLTKYLKDINTTLNRPWIYLKMEEGYPPNRTGWQRYWTLKVPKSPKLKNVVASLLMVADEESVIHIPHERSWEFQFLGAKGKEFKEEWLRNVKEDQVFRLCLGLPLKVSV